MAIDAEVALRCSECATIVGQVTLDGDEQAVGMYENGVISFSSYEVGGSATVRCDDCSI